MKERIDGRERETWKRQSSLSLLSWTLAESSSAISPSVMCTTGFSKVFFIYFFWEDPHFKKLLFSMGGQGVWVLTNTYPPQKKMHAAFENRDLHNSSTLHLTSPEVPICGLPKAWLQVILSLIRAVVTDWPYNSAPCWFHRYSKVFLGTLTNVMCRQDYSLICMYSLKLIYTYMHTCMHKHTLWQKCSHCLVIHVELVQSSFEMASLTKSLSFPSMFIQHFAAIYPDLFPAACLLKSS